MSGNTTVKLFAARNNCAACDTVKNRVDLDQDHVEVVYREDQLDEFNDYGIRSVPRALRLDDGQVVEDSGPGMVDEITRMIES